MKLHFFVLNLLAKRGVITLNFAEKLSSLLSLTDTTNIALARAVKIDPAQVSRMRRGVRGIPHNSSSVREIAAFFSKKCMTDYRCFALYELIKDTRLKSQPGESVLTDVLTAWLSSQSPGHTVLDVHSPQNGEEVSLTEFSSSLSVPFSQAEGRDVNKFFAYYGNVGKRQALRDLFSYLTELKKPCLVLIASDEDCCWYLEDSDLSRQCAASLIQLAQKGCAVQLIQSPVTNIDVALNFVSLWLPVYLSGKVHQYYYPWLRDNIHHRTIIVVPGHIALVSSSVGSRRESRITFLTMEKKSISAFSGEFADYQALCSPMLIPRSIDLKKPLWQNMVDFESILAEGICINSVLPARTVPSELLDSIFRRIRYDPLARDFHTSFECQIASAAAMMENCSVTDVIWLSEFRNAKDGKVKIPFAVLFSGGELCYTAKEYAMHLRQTVVLLKRYPRYQVVLLDHPPVTPVSIYTKPGCRSMIVNAIEPFATLEITEPGMLAAFGEYVRQTVAGVPARNAEKTSVIAVLNERILQLEE